MNIRITINGTPVDATLNDTSTAQDFAALLPLTLSLTDFQQTEKIADLTRRLYTSGAPDGAGRAGDLAYFAPWGNLAMYYRGEGGDPYPGLIIIGHMAESGVELLSDAGGDVNVTIEEAL